MKLWRRGAQSATFRSLRFIFGKCGGMEAFKLGTKVVSLGFRKLTLAAEWRRLPQPCEQEMEFQGRG